MKKLLFLTLLISSTFAQTDSLEQGWLSLVLNVDAAAEAGVLDPNTSEVYVAGTFTDWELVSMDLQFNSSPISYNQSFPLTGPQEYTYAYYSPQQDEIVYESAGIRAVTVAPGNFMTLYDVLEFDSSNAEYAAVYFNVSMDAALWSGNFFPDMDQVSVVGSFSDWQPIPLDLTTYWDVSADTLYETYSIFIDVELGIHEYKYMITHPNGETLLEYGENRILEAVPGEMWLPLASFRVDTTGDDPGEPRNVTFNVDMSLATASGLFLPGVDAVSVGGEFNSWELEPLALNEDNDELTYTTSLEIAEGIHEYKYVIQRPSGNTLWEVGVNRTLFVGNSDVWLPTSPFNLGQSTTLDGWVLDVTTGGPITNADIELTPMDVDFGPSISGSSDSAGAFLFTDLEPIPYMVMINADGYTAYAGLIDFPAQTSYTALLEPLFDGGTAGIQGSVVQDSLFLPVMMGYVAAIDLDSQESYTAILDAAGSYFLDVPSGEYVVLALGFLLDMDNPEVFGIHLELYDDAYTLADATPVTVSAGSITTGIDFIFPLTLENAMPMGNMVMGTVTETSGAPVAGSMVYLMDGTAQVVDSTLVDDEGSFSFGGLLNDGNYTLMAQHSAYGTTTTDMHSQSMFEVERLVFGTTSVEARMHPVEFQLSAFPNPFNPQTTIQYGVEVSGAVELAIYNLVGQRVATLVDEQLVAGRYQVEWNGINSLNEAVPTGVYLAVLANQGQRETLKLLYLK